MHDAAVRTRTASLIQPGPLPDVYPHAQVDEQCCAARAADSSKTRRLREGTRRQRSNPCVMRAMADRNPVRSAETGSERETELQGILNLTPQMLAVMEPDGRISWLMRLLAQAGAHEPSRSSHVVAPPRLSAPPRKRHSIESGS